MQDHMEHLDGIDYLRVIMSFFVVFWHMGGRDNSLIFSPDRFQLHTFTLSDLVNFELLTLAVPTFVFISVFLHIYRGAAGDVLIRRLKRLGLLLAFWPAALVIFFKGWYGMSDFVPYSLGQAVHVALTAGNTVYYFFVCLIICLVAAHYYAKLSPVAQAGLFLVSIMLLLMLPQITKTTGVYQLSSHWNPFNFIPVSLAAVIMAQNRNLVNRRTAAISISCLFLFVFFSVIEWRYDLGEIFFPGQGSAIPSYTRVSLLFGVIGLAAVFLRPGIRAGVPIRRMAEFSLGLYCLHVFLKEPVKAIAVHTFRNSFIIDYGSIVMVILGCYLTVWFFRKYFRFTTIL